MPNSNIINDIIVKILADKQDNMYNNISYQILSMNLFDIKITYLLL